MEDPGFVSGYVEAVEFGTRNTSDGCAVVTSIRDKDCIDEYEKRVNTPASLAVLIVLSAAMLNAEAIQVL